MQVLDEIVIESKGKSETLLAERVAASAVIVEVLAVSAHAYVIEGEVVVTDVVMPL